MGNTGREVEEVTIEPAEDPVPCPIEVPETLPMKEPERVT